MAAAAGGTLGENRRSDSGAIRRHVIAASGITALGGLLFGCLTLVALVYFARKVPETKGRSLQQIEHDLTADPRAVVRAA